MSSLPAIPWNLALGLLVFSVLGTLIGLYILLVVLWESRLRRLSSLLMPPSLAVSVDGKETFGLPGTEDTARDLLRLALTQGGAEFALLFLPRVDDCFRVSTFEGDGSPWRDAELAGFLPPIKRLKAGDGPIELEESQVDVPLPAHTILVPIRSRGHLIAIVAVGPRDVRRPISRQSQRALAAAAQHVAVPLENAQLYGSLRRAFSDLENERRVGLALQRVSLAAQSTLRLDQVLQEIADGVADGLALDTVIVFLADAEKRTISMPVVSGSTPAGETPGEPVAFTEPHPAIDALLAGEVLVTHDVGESVLPRLAATSDFDPSALTFETVLVTLPLIFNGRVMGGMTLVSRSAAIPSHQLESLKGFAAQAAAAIENARLYGELKRAFGELRTAQDQLIRAERLRTLGQVASGVAHDFNNILAAIVTRAQLAQLQTRSAPLLETLRVIEQAALDGASAARRIQTLARPKNDQTAEILDLNDVVQHAIELTRPMWSNQAQARGATIKAVTCFGSDLLVEGQASELREVLTNLILNAAAAMPDGGTLTLTTERRGADVWCTVEDTGIGMPEEVRERIFEPFFTTKGEAGSGLGLSIVAAILQRHQGRIEIDSTPGKGTAVRFCLPASQGRSAERKSKRRRGKVSLRLLLAEEDAPTRDALSLILVKNGHRVVPAADADEALQLLEQQEFDVVITDLGLGDRSGWEVAQATKTLRPSAAVILATAWGAAWDAAEARQRGVDGILPKPFTVDEVLSSVQRALLQGG